MTSDRLKKAAGRVKLEPSVGTAMHGEPWTVKVDGEIFSRHVHKWKAEEQEEKLIRIIEGAKCREELLANECFTGDCPHDNANDCVAAIKGHIGSIYDKTGVNHGDEG